LFLGIWKLLLPACLRHSMLGYRETLAVPPVKTAPGSRLHLRKNHPDKKFPIRQILPVAAINAGSFLPYQRMFIGKFTSVRLNFN